jgi:hypothetical protein
MSEPTKYKMPKFGTKETIDCVSYVEYAKLKAEVERLDTLCKMLKDQINGLIIDNQLLGERVLSYQRLKQLNDISRPSNEA